MVKPRIIRSVLLLACIGIIVTALVQPIAGSTMGKGKLMEQKDKMIPCPENKSMMKSGMGENESSEMYETSSKEKMMGSMMEEKSCNEAMTSSMIKEKLANKSCYNASSSQANLDCARLWLEKAIKLHAMHLENPKSVTNESQMEMMDQMKQAKNYLSGEKMNMSMMDRAAENKSAEYEHPYAISALMRLECSDFWLDEAIKLHAMHLKNPKIATNESQIRLMAQMVRANRYLAGEDMNMEMTKNASLSQDNVNLTTLWLEKAIKLHAMNLENPRTATNESQMRLMNQMMQARECIGEKNLNLEMVMDFEEDSARDMYKPSSKEMCEPSPREKMMAMMMGSMRMGEKSYNETMMKSMMSSMMKEKEDKMKSMMEEKEDKKDKMESMMKEKLANESCTSKMDQKANLTRANYDGICLCLDKAIKLHEMYLRNPEATTSEYKMEMMKQMMQAHEYLTGKKMDMGMMNKVADNKSTGKLKETLGNLSTEKSEQSENYSSSGC